LRSAGFTIIELLTVLVLIGLVSFVLMTGFERVLDIRLRLTAFLDGVEAPILVADWFRATIGGLVADAANGPDRFVGRPRQLTGLSLAPVNGTAGVPTRITWEVVFDDNTGRSALRYRNGEDPPLTIASWPGNMGGLRYCGPDLVCHEVWPPDPKATQLPLLLELDAVYGGDPWPILATPRADRTPLLTSSDDL
jgi:prepilin-type N-terminal cleavage/methylation domain-containing protein